MVILLIGGALAGACLYLNRTRALPIPPTEAVTEPAVEPAVLETSESPPAAEPALAGNESPLTAPSRKKPAQKPVGLEPRSAPTQAALDAATVNQAVDMLASSQVSRSQKQATWKQWRDAGKLDLVIAELQQRMSADPRAAEYPATLGQAYLKKCATLQDLRDQGILAMQADKLFDAALDLDPSNWEARFTKAVALSYWPPNMNKGDEVVSLFQTLIQQQESQPQQPHFAETYSWLEDQYQRSGSNDLALAMWERGASLFPNNDGLRKKLSAANAASRAIGN